MHINVSFFALSLSLSFDRLKEGSLWKEGCVDGVGRCPMGIFATSLLYVMWVASLEFLGERI